MTGLVEDQINDGPEFGSARSLDVDEVSVQLINAGMRCTTLATEGVVLDQPATEQPRQPGVGL